MKCEYCEKTFDEEPTKKVIKGKDHIFCTECCYNFFIYNYPKRDLPSMYSNFVVYVSVPNFRQLIEETSQ